MRYLADATLARALAEWGAHEASGRFRGRTGCDPADPLACIDFALLSRAPYVARILAREPLATLRVALEPEDVPALWLADGRSVGQWIDATAEAGGEAHAHFLRLVSQPDEGRGRLVCAGRIVEGGNREMGSVVVYDGWHRVAAWFETCRRGRPMPLEAYLVVVKHPDPLLTGRYN